jgi:uncharacterized protein YktB (UPF0637 family)
MEFTGFTEEQFDVFDIPDFAARMAAIRDLVRPALRALGETLAPRLSDLVGCPLFPRVALHARRRVNPPDDTWVAFGQSERGYKGFAHLAVGIESAGAYTALVLKSEAEDDRKRLGTLLVTRSEDFMEEWALLHDYEAEEFRGMPVSQLNTGVLDRLGKAMVSHKTGSLHLLSRIPRSDPRLGSAEECQTLACRRLEPVIPIFLKAVG